MKKQALSVGAAAVFLLGFCACAWGQAEYRHAENWLLPGIFGHDPAVVQPGKNWLSDNPRSDRGAKWSLYFKDGDAFRLMERGKAYHFNYVWREKGDSAEPKTFFIERTLNAAIFKGAGTGPESAVVFVPDVPAKFNVSIDGLVSVQHAASGKARVELRVVDPSLSSLRVLAGVQCKDKEPFRWEGEVELKGSEALALALSPINAGDASCGHTSLNIRRFAVRSTVDRTVSLPLDIASWRPRDPSRVDIKPGPEGELNFEVKPGSEDWIVLAGPSIAVPKRDQFASHRQVEVRCEAKAQNAEGLVMHLRARQDGGGYTRSRSPGALWEATLELPGAERWKSWAQFEGGSMVSNNCSKLVFEMWLAVPKGHASSISLRGLECTECFTPSHRLTPEPMAEGNIFFSDSGSMKVEFANASNVSSWRVASFDENDSLVFQKSGETAPSPLTVALSGIGFYRLVVSATYTDGSKLETETNAAVVGEPLPDSIRMHSRFGSDRVHGNGAIWKKSGARWDWELGKIQLKDWILNADGSIAPPPGWKPLTHPADYSPIFAVASYPKWLRGPMNAKLCPPQDWALYERLFEAFAKANPELEYISMYNEPNACWSGSREEFIKFNTAMAEGCKRGNPKLKLLGPACYAIDMKEFREYLRGGMFDSLGGVNIHAYVNGTAPEGEFIERVQAMCNSLKEAGKGNLPVHLTEFGWCSVDGDWQKTVPETTRSRYVARSLSLLTAQPVDNITYFCFQIVRSARGPEYALLYPDGTPTPSYVSFVNTVKWLSEIKRGDARWFRPSRNLNLVLGKAAGRIVGSAWTIDGEEAFQLPGIPLRTTDMMGRTLHLAAGSRTVKLSPSPIFFELPADCQFLDMPEQPRDSTGPGSHSTSP